jgi:DNA-binding transcriptional LysR family regulator
MRRLEKQLNTKLFHKSPLGYDLTVEGQRLVPFAEDMEVKAEEANEAIAGQAKRMTGTIRIGAPEGVASHLMSMGLAELCRTNPDLAVQVVAMPRVFSLSKREVDFAVALSYPPTGRLKVRKISEYRLHIYASADYLARHPVNTVKDVSRCRGIGYVSDLIFDRELDYIPLVSSNLEPRLTSTSLWVQLEWTRQGAGLCVLPDFIARRHSDLLPVLVDTFSLTRTFWLLAHEDNLKLDRIARCSDKVVESIARVLKEPA